jgi:hypothetical protein
MDNRWVHSPSLFTGICGLLFYLYLWILLSVIFLVESDILKLFTGICGLLFYLYLWILVSVILLVESDILKFFRTNPSLCSFFFGYVLCINKLYVSFSTLFSYSVYILCMFHSQLALVLCMSY